MQSSSLCCRRSLRRGAEPLLGHWEELKQGWRFPPWALGGAEGGVKCTSILPFPFLENVSRLYLHGIFWLCCSSQFFGRQPVVETRFLNIKNDLF